MARISLSVLSLYGSLSLTPPQPPTAPLSSKLRAAGAARALPLLICDLSHELPSPSSIAKGSWREGCTAASRSPTALARAATSELAAARPLRRRGSEKSKSASTQNSVELTRMQKAYTPGRGPSTLTLQANPRGQHDTVRLTVARPTQARTRTHSARSAHTNYSLHGRGDAAEVASITTAHTQRAKRTYELLASWAGKCRRGRVHHQRAPCFISVDRHLIDAQTRAQHMHSTSEITDK